LRLVDFGLVHPFFEVLHSSDPNSIPSHPFLGTLLYASDFVLQSRRVYQVNPLDDLWSFFWVVYAMLVGGPPG
jgi:hypothetical protein